MWPSVGTIPCQRRQASIPHCHSVGMRKVFTAMPVRSLSLLLVALLVVSCDILHSTSAAASSSSSSASSSNSQSSSSSSSISSSSSPVCQPVNGISFPKRPPGPATDLAFCKEYRPNTCCDRSATQQILRYLSPFFDPSSSVSTSFSDRCRQLSSVVACSACDPRLGTGSFAGLCPSLCDEWFSACAFGLFTSSDSDGLIRPCTDSSLICAPLSEVVRSGEELCRRSGFLVDTSDSEATALATAASAVKIIHPVQAEVMRLVDAAEREAKRKEQQRAARAALKNVTGHELDDDGADVASLDDDLTASMSGVTCFDGRPPSSSTLSGATPSSSDFSSDSSSSSSTRYYKTAEEVAEIERRRAQRQAAARDAQHTWLNIVTRAVRNLWNGMQRSMRQSRMVWRDLLRSMPIPMKLRQVLDGWVGYGLVLLLFTYVLQTFITRCSHRWQRRPPLFTVEGSTRGLDSNSWWPSSAAPPSTDYAGAFSSSGLSADEVRRRRLEKIMQQQYVQGSSNTTDESSAAATSTPNGQRAPSKGTYKTVIDGDIVELPE